MKMCSHCEEPILPEEEVPNGTPGLHQECALRMVIGSADHVLRGPHCVGSCEPDDPGLTRREAARAAVAAWVSMRDVIDLGGVM